MAASGIGDQLKSGSIGLTQLSGNEKAKTRPEMMGREERLENLRPRRIGNPLAVIDDMQLNHPGSRANLSPQKHTAHRSAGVANRIGQQVPQDLVQVRSIKA